MSKISINCSVGETHRKYGKLQNNYVLCCIMFFVLLIQLGKKVNEPKVIFSPFSLYKFLHKLEENVEEQHNVFTLKWRRATEWECSGTAGCISPLAARWAEMSIFTPIARVCWDQRRWQEINESCCNSGTHLWRRPPRKLEIKKETAGQERLKYRKEAEQEKSLWYGNWGLCVFKRLCLWM